MAKNRIKIESKDLDGNDIAVYITRPTKEESGQAQIVASKVFKEAMVSGALVRTTLENLLRKQGIWDDEKQAEVDKIDEEVKELLLKLKAGGIKLTEARQIGIDIRLARLRKNAIMSTRNEHDEYTAEAQSENAKFDYLASVCIKNEEGEPIFEDVEAYRDAGEQPYVIECAGKLAGMLYGLDENWESSLPENQFLQKYGFVDEDLRLVNKEGKYVTTDGRLIDNDFRYINEAGEYVDYDGNRIDEDGLPIVESQPFLDDDGNPIVDEEPKKRGRPKKAAD